MDRKVELGPKIGEAIYPLTTEVRYFFDNQDPEHFTGGNIHFGNSGLTVSISKKFANKLHFVPDFQFHAPESNSDEDVQRKVKYARMFAVGMLALINYFQTLDFSKLDSSTSQMVQAGGSFDTLHFDTNKTMLDFARKMFGHSYFVSSQQKETPETEKQTKFSEFRLKNLLIDSLANPELLAKARKFADPEKLREIKSVIK